MDRMLTSEQVQDGSGNVFARTDYTYDEYTTYPLQLSGASPGRLTTTYIVSNTRGNPTTVHHYVTPTTFVSTHAQYFDNGVAYQTIDAKGSPASTVTAFDFTDCSTSHVTTTTTSQNALSQSVSTLSDCATGLALSKTNLYAGTSNVNYTCVQYDGLGTCGRSAGPGDTLSTETQCAASGGNPTSCYLKDPSTTRCPTAGTTIGNGGAGATTWKQYLNLGVINQQRTQVYAKDGTSTGKYARTFVDGLWAHDSVLQQHRPHHHSGRRSRQRDLYIYGI